MNTEKSPPETDGAGGFITDFDIYLFKQGTHFHLFDKLGSHLIEIDGVKGAHFAVWAPDAKSVSVIGDFNKWNKKRNALAARPDGSGVWEGFIPGVGKGSLYKYHIKSRFHRYQVDKGDPFAFHWETPPRTSSIVWELSYDWDDAAWMKTRKERTTFDSPMCVYEMHLGSWRRAAGREGRFFSYREIAPPLTEHLLATGFTHVEFLPVMEHPFYGSWGYQSTGYFAPTSRYGTPQDFMFLVDYLHRHGIGVILDWVPSHFPNDEYGLAYFDGTHVYEHADPRKGFHPDWRSAIFNYGRNEVRAFLISSALFWLKKYHIDGLRIDAVASMLYLDYSRQEGEWIPNKYGGRENLEAIEFIKLLNQTVYTEVPDVQTVAEESTAWPMVTRPPYVGGLGFGMKWNMGWMHDTLEYFSKDPIYRKYHHNQLTFSIWYAFQENFVLPLSHDEVVHGKGSLLGKMPGDDWQKFASLRLLLSYMYGHPGKKLLFMGAEIAQWREWNHDESLDWHLLDHPPHQGVLRLITDLNRIHREEPALHQLDFSQEGFQWVDAGDWESSIVSFLRKGRNIGEEVLVVCNATPVPRHHYRVGVPAGGFWREILNSDSDQYGGSGHGNYGGTTADAVEAHGRPFSLTITVPPLGALFFRRGEPRPPLSGTVNSAPAR